MKTLKYISFIGILSLAGFAAYAQIAIPSPHRPQQAKDLSEDETLRIMNTKKSGDLWENGASEKFGAIENIKADIIRKLKEKASEKAAPQNKIKPASPVSAAKNYSEEDDASASEISKFNATKALRLDVAKSSNELVRARQTRAKGQSMVREGRALSNRGDSIAGAGTTMARYVNRSGVRAEGRRIMEEGEALIRKADAMEAEVRSLYRSLQSSCESIVIKSADDKEIVCIPLAYKNGTFTVFARNSVYKIKDEVLDEASRKKIQIYKSL